MTRTISLVAVVGVLIALAAAGALAAELIGADVLDRTLYRIDTDEGTVTPIGYHGVASGFCGLDYATREDALIGVTRMTNARLYLVDPSTAVATYIGDLGIGYVFEGALAYDPTTGFLYGANGGSDEEPQLFTVDPSTGAAVLLGVVGGGVHDFAGLAFDAEGQLYGLDRFTNALWAIDKYDPDGPGTMQIGSGLGSGIDLGPVGGMATGPEGVVYGYASGSHQLFTVNLADGTGTVLHTFGDDVPTFYAVAFGGGGYSPVEPSTWSSIKAMYAN